MLKKLKVKNYLSWKDLEIDFSDKITAICGETGHGKTPILTAIKLISTLRPSGFSYLSHFAKEKQVDIGVELENGSVDLKKTKNKLQYVLNGDKDNAFSETNKKVPDEIKDLIKIDSDNFSFQFDGPYLIFSGNSIISKKINESIGIEKYDQKLKELTKIINDSKKQIKPLFQSIKKRKKVLKNIKKMGFDDLDARIEEKEKIEVKIKESIDALSYLKYTFDFLKKSRVEYFEKKLEKSQKLLEKYSKVSDELKSTEHTVSLLKELLRIKNTPNPINKICKLKEKLTTQIEKINSIKKSIKREEELISDILELKSTCVKIDKIENEIIKLTKKRNKIEVCPECGQILQKI